jgi:hypothetical protein
METIDLSAEEFARWRKAVQPVFDRWIQERETAGAPGRQMAERMQELAGIR